MTDLLAALKAAAEPTRLRILGLLDRAELTVTELTQILGQSQPRLSRHLKLMAEAGLVDRFREGAWVFHRPAADGTGAALANHLRAMLNRGDSTYLRDQARLDGVLRARTEVAADYFAANAAQWDRIRALHVSEAEVDAALTRILGEAPIGLLLDIGTGTGHMLELFGPKAERGLGVDLSHEMLGIARAKLDGAGLYHCQVRHGDMNALPVGDETVDLVLFHQVLHFAADPQAAIDEAARVLAPGGRVALVDFLPHAHEELREHHAHRRLGFAPREVAQWGQHAHLDIGLAETLSGDPLTVGLWLGRKPGRPALGRAAAIDTVS
ncbi:methyltransferase domain-containing protein [Oleomonas cavernae]|uniref:Methyltransferase domain-containing protein n=1 Tax=Oleomonas cavernae TaxID=2320859 RepID=A0A418W9B8_9PROT|nr:metalloregulator ArsR/SmtB family transcription factor [Oleomonas cavernae]RJF86615.1 methyltransferase domain-containing protein [Oleomonas cavernae]